MGTQTTVPFAQAEDSGLLGPLQSPNWVKVCLVSTIFFLPVSIVPRVEKCLGLSVGNRVLCLWSLTVDFCKFVCCFVSCQSHMSRHLLKGYWRLSCQLGKGGVQALDHLVWISWGPEGLTGSQWRWQCFPCFSHSLTGALQMYKWPVSQLDSWSTEGHQEPREKWCHHLGIWHRLCCRH